MIFTHARDVDESGRAVIRQAATNKGWTYQALFLEYETSTGIFYCRDHLNNDLSSQFSLQRFSSESDLTQINLLVVKDVITWKPDFDYEIISGNIRQANLALLDNRMWVTGGMYNEASKYEPLVVKEFVTGGLNLTYIKEARTDGRASKFISHLTEGAPFPTNRFQWTLRHEAGVANKILVNLELFKV